MNSAARTKPATLRTAKKAIRSIENMPGITTELDGETVTIWCDDYDKGEHASESVAAECHGANVVSGGGKWIVYYRTGGGALVDAPARPACLDDFGYVGSVHHY